MANLNLGRQVFGMAAAWILADLLGEYPLSDE